MTHYWFKLLAAAAILLFAQPAFSSTLLSARSGGECDSIFLSNGKAYAVKQLSWNDSEVSFAFCDDPEGKMHTAPWMQIDHLKKADGSVIDSPARRASGPGLNQEELRLEKQVSNLKTTAIISVVATLLFAPVGIIMAIIVLGRSATLKKAVIGHPNEKSLLKKIKRSVRIVKTMLLLLLILGMAMFGYLIYFFSLFDKNQ